jgi:hypothetical protein
MRRGAISVVAVVALAGVVASMAPASGQADGEAAPIYGVELPPGYRDWRLISVARVGGPLNDLRAKLGNEVAIKAYREGKRPFPDGTIVARLAWRQVPSGETNEALGRSLERGSSADALQKLLADSFEAGPPTNVQVMVKDSRTCHEPAKDRDCVFTRYAP